MMPRDGIASTNGRNKTYEALVKSLFTNISHAKEPEIPPRPQSRIGFRRNRPPKIKSRPPQQDRPLLDGEHPTGATTRSHGADEDEDTAESETSDEWSTDSDTSDTASPNDLSPCSAVPPSPPPILVPDAFPGHDLPTLAIQTDLPARSPPLPLRPIFPHHGLSRSALQHQKWLWNARHDEWIQWRAEVETAEAEMGPYGGISNAVAIEPPAPLRRPRVSSSSPVLPPESELPSSSASRRSELNEKIFPRTGDITDLHDPQVTRLDQTFSNYPLWTIQKVLFVCSMDSAARGRSSPLARNSGNDTAAPPSSVKEAEMKAHVAVPHAPPASESAIPLLTKLRWEQSWHTRWEVLTALVRMTEQAVLAQGPTTIPATVTTPIGLPVVARSLADVDECSNTRDSGRFFFANPEELGASDGSESDDDDEEEEEDDYGEIILNPRFGLSRSMTAERGLGHPFLRAHQVPIDARSGFKARSS
jgi:hypothetical protein